MNEAIESAIKIALAQQREEIARKIEGLRISEYEPGDHQINEMVALAAHIVRGMK